MITKLGKAGVMVLSAVASAAIVAIIFSTLALFAYAAEGDDPNRARMSITPSSGISPLDVQVTMYAESQLLCTAFSLDWGDGSPVESYDPGEYEENCYGGKFKRDFFHTYATSSASTTVYSVHAKAGPNSLENLNTMTLLVTLRGDDWVEDSGGTTQEKATCFVDPSTGSEPFVAAAYVPLGGEFCDGTYEYYIDWGDGFGSESRFCNNEAIHYDTFYHEYSTSGNYTAELVRLHDDTTFPVETCAVDVTEASNITITKPNWKEDAVIGYPFDITWEIDNIPLSKDGITPNVRLTFVTTDGQAGFIADVATDQTSYVWIPTSEPCLEGACQSSIANGEYYIQASLIYDTCNGDPYCGEPVPVISSDISADTIVVSDTGIPISSWLYTVHDRLFAYPVVAQAPSTINFTTVLNSEASCAGGSYVIEYGDGSSSSQAFPLGGCASFASSFTHTYSEAGNYRVILHKNGIPVASMNITITDPVIATQSRLNNLASAWAAFTNLLVKWVSF